MTDADKNAAETPIKTVERLAALARIQIPEERKETLAGEFEQILAYIAQLDELQLAREGKPALPPVHNVFREDASPNGTGEWTETIVKAFPAKTKDNALVVKKIITLD